MTDPKGDNMATAERPQCGTCKYKSGNTEIIICQNPVHFGLAMRIEEFCGAYEPISKVETTERPGGGKLHRVIIAETIKGKDAGAGGSRKKKEEK